MKGVLVQFGSTFILGILNFITSISITWPSSALPFLRSDQSPLGTTISQNDENLIGSLPMLGSLLATLYAGLLLEYIGRKRTEVLCGLCYVLSCAIIATANSTPLLLIGRFLSGIGSGMHGIAVLVYAGEICQVAIVGTVMANMLMLYCCGNLVSYLTGWLCSYDVVNYLNLTFCVIYTVLVCYLKETPAYLLRRGKEKEALDSLNFYRGVSHATPEVMAEFDNLRQQINATVESSHLFDTERIGMEPEKEQLNKDDSIKTIKEPSAWRILYTTKSTQRAIILISLHIFLVVCMGTIAVQAYAGQFFSEAAPSLSSNLCSIVMAITVAAGSCITVTVTGFVGRRVHMLTSCIASTLCLALLGSLLRWSWAPEWVTAVVVLVFFLVFQMGAGAIPFMQLGESFLPQMKSLATTIAMCVMCLANFIVLAIFRPSVTYLGLDGTFFMFAIIGAVTATSTYLLMKETRGVPVEDIIAMYEDGYLYRKRKA